MQQVAAGLAVREVLRVAAVTSARLTEALDGSGLNVDRWRVLAHVAEHPGVSMSDVVEALAMAPATATRAVDGLVESGAVYRAADPADRRRVVVSASSTGTALLRAVSPAVAAAEAALPVAAPA